MLNWTPPRHENKASESIQKYKKLLSSFIIKSNIIVKPLLTIHFCVTFLCIVKRSFIVYIQKWIMEESMWIHWLMIGNGQVPLSKSFISPSPLMRDDDSRIQFSLALTFHSCSSVISAAFQNPHKIVSFLEALSLRKCWMGKQLLRGFQIYGNCWY